MECKCGLPAESSLFIRVEAGIKLRWVQSRCSVVGTTAFLFIVAT
jgi:hypothetical protein